MTETAYSDQNSQFADLVHAALKKHADKINVPGYAFALIKDGKVILNVVSGVKAISKTDKIDENTMFQSGSIAKAFTALTAVKMVQNGKFKLDDFIEKHLIPIVWAADIAYELFEGDKEKARTWMLTPNSYFFGKSPFNVCLVGEGKAVIELLLERSGR